jgi:hypothetical protein
MRSKIKRLIKRICIGLAASAKSREMMGKGPGYGMRGNQRMKALMAAAVIATTAATAQAGDPIQYEDYAAYNWFMRAWNSVFGGFTMGDFAQGLSTSNQPTPQALANDAAYGFSNVQSPNGPQGPAGGEGKWHSKNP